MFRAFRFFLHGVRIGGDLHFAWTALTAVVGGGLLTAGLLLGIVAWLLDLPPLAFAFVAVGLALLCIAAIGMSVSWIRLGQAGRLIKRMHSGEVKVVLTRDAIVSGAAIDPPEILSRFSPTVTTLSVTGQKDFSEVEAFGRLQDRGVIEPKSSRLNDHGILEYQFTDLGKAVVWRLREEQVD